MPESEDYERTWVMRPSPEQTPRPPSPPASATATVAHGSPSNELELGTSIGEFEIVGLIGVGGFGIVYRAHDRSLGRDVALKEYMPSSLAARIDGLTVSVQSPRLAETFAIGLRSFVNEARLLAQFDHPSLVKVYRFWEANGTAYMVMPFYEGVTLKQALQKMPGPPNEAWLKGIISPLLDALEVIHHENCFHRDIAPDNILLLADGRPLLLDFGAARRVISDRTQALTVILKPGYAPLEQYAEVPHVKQGAWTDIYAMAAVVYNAITGRPPMPSVARSMSDAMVPLSKAAAGRYSDAFLSAIDIALSVRPEARPQTIAEWREMLALNESKSPPASAPPAAQGPRDPLPVAARPQMEKDNRSMRLALVAGVVVALAGGAFYALKPKPEVSASPKPAAVASSRPVSETLASSSSTTAKPVGETPAVGTPQIQTSDRKSLTEQQLVDMLLGKDGAVGQGKNGVKPFDPIDMLQEIYQQRDVNHLVTVLPEKAKVRIGQDKLRFRVTSDKPGYLYILMVGTDRNHFNLLFPNAIDADNAIAGDGELNLPRPGWAMTAGGPPGANRFVAIVSENRRDFTAAGLKRVDPFGEFPLKFAEKIAQQATGGSNPFAGKVICPSGRNCSTRFGAAIFAIEEVE